MASVCQTFEFSISEVVSENVNDKKCLVGFKCENMHSGSPLDSWGPQSEVKLSNVNQSLLNLGVTMGVGMTP